MSQERRTVLVVDDDPFVRKMVHAYLDGLNMNVLEAADSKSAREQISKNGFDLVFLDVVLPEASGYDLCDFIRHDSRHKDVLVLMMSARAFPEDRAEAEELGADGYIVKPFSRRAFVDQVQEVLSRTREQRGDA